MKSIYLINVSRNGHTTTLMGTSNLDYAEAYVKEQNGIQEKLKTGKGEGSSLYFLTSIPYYDLPVTPDDSTVG